MVNVRERLATRVVLFLEIKEMDMMFARVMVAAVSIGILGGASLAVARNLGAPAPETQVRAEAPLHPVVRGAEEAPCDDVDFRVYFSPDSHGLNTDARQTIATAVHDMRRCGRIDIEVAADETRLDSGAGRRLSAQRSVAILSEIRRQGLSGDVFVAPVKDVIVVAEQNAGPDFVEVGLSGSVGGELLSGAGEPPTAM
jgi:hypothetical protein